MKKALRRTIIVLIAIMTLALATVTVNAAAKKTVTSVTIQNEKTGKQLTFTNDIPNGMTEASLKPEKKAQELKSIYTREWLMKYGKECIGRDEINQILAVTEGKTGSESLEGILRSVKKNDVSELNYLQFVSIMAHFKKLAA